MNIQDRIRLKIFANILKKVKRKLRLEYVIWCLAERIAANVKSV